MENFKKVEKIKQFEAKDLSGICNKYYDAVDKIYEEVEGSRDYKKIRGRIEEYTVGYMQELLKSKEKFLNVFKTENGSLYFVVKSGQSLRFKKQETGNGDFETKINPIMDKIFFIDEGEVYEIMKEDKIELNEEKIIKIVKYGIGVRPFELNFYKDRSTKMEIVEIGSDNILVKGFAPYHIGHKITEIIK
ncbi:MAG: hypothetical protein WCO84_04560 [bacterium]